LPDSLDPRRWRRIAVLGALALVIEMALMFVARLTPAMAGLMRPAYVLVAVIAILMGWQASRRREGSDRRQDERRDAEPNDSSA
jgi:membrane protein implicated in regulation of membrane protease activity